MVNLPSSDKILKELLGFNSPGTYRQTAPNAYTEHVEKNLHLPQLVGVDNILEFEMKGGDVMVLKFFVKTDKDGNEINSWYYETWKRVKMPPVYPKDLVR